MKLQVALLTWSDLLVPGAPSDWEALRRNFEQLNFILPSLLILSVLV